VGKESSTIEWGGGGFVVGGGDFILIKGYRRSGMPNSERGFSLSERWLCGLQKGESLLPGGWSS